MHKSMNELGNVEDEDDLIKRMEATGANMRPVKYYEGPDFICCSETLEQAKSRPCDTPAKPVTGLQVQCLGKGMPPPEVCQWSVPINERDILFRPIRWRCQNHSATKRKKVQEPSLGSPIGVSKSSFSMRYIEKKPTDRSLQGFATNLIAFAEYFITPEIEWDEKVLNRILLEGQRLYEDSRGKLKQEHTLKEETILRTFVLCGNAFELLINEPFMMGQVIGQESDIPNLHWALLKFFKKFQFCLLKINKWYALLWSNADVYFIFDCFGRRYLDLRSDRKNGDAVLVCLRHIDNVSHLLMNLSGVHPDDLFVLKNMQIKSLVPCGGEPARDVVDRVVEYEIISPIHAILRARIHLGSSCFKEIRMRQALPVAFCALINAKIDATPTWDRTVLDNIIQFGTSFYKQWTQCDFSIDLLIQDVPKFVFGQFLVKIAVEVIIESGLWMCSPNYRNSELSLALRRAFQKALNLLVQIQDRTYAVWKKGKFYYVLDPYSHQCSLQRKKLKTAALHMCASFDKLCCVFTQSLLELFEESKFVIHSVKITELEESDIEYGSKGPCICVAAPRKQADEEVRSLNESVAGFDTYECQAEESGGESDLGDLDSPGLSQTLMEDYSDMRRNLIDDSESEDDEDGDDDEDLSDLELDEAKKGGGGSDSDDEGDGHTRSGKDKDGKGSKDKSSKDRGDKRDKGEKGDKKGKGKKGKSGRGDADTDSSTDSRGRKGSKTKKGKNDGKDSKGSKGSKDRKGGKDGKDSKHSKDSKDSKKEKKDKKGKSGESENSSDSDDSTDSKDRKAKKGKKGSKDSKESKEADDSDDAKKTKDGKGGKGDSKDEGKDGSKDGSKDGKGGKDGSKDGTKDGAKDGSKDGKDGSKDKDKSKEGSKDGKDGSKDGKDGKGESKDGKDGSKDGKDGSKEGKGEKSGSKDGKDGSKDEKDGKGGSKDGKGGKDGSKDGKDGKDESKDGKDGKGGSKDGKRDGSQDRNDPTKGAGGNKNINEEGSKTPGRKLQSDHDDQPGSSRGRESKEDESGRDGTDLSEKTSLRSRGLRQRRKQQDDDGSSSSDERPSGNLPSGCKPNSYPGFTQDAQNLAVIGSESGSYESLCNLLKSAFRCADRILTMTPWGNYVAFRSYSSYFIYDGCTCNLRSIRHMDLSVGTAGLLCFPDLHSLIRYIENGKEGRRPTQFSKKSIVDQICSKYCSR